MVKNILLVLMIGMTTCIQAQAPACGNRSEMYSDLYKDTPVTLQQPILPAIPELSVDITDYGAIGDGVTMCTDAIQSAIDDVAAKGGGHVNIPSGIFMITSLELHNNIDLHLDHNAILQQTPDKSLYKMSAKKGRLLPCIYGNNLHDISITGQGTIDGMGKYWRPVKRGKMSDVEWSQYVRMGGTIEDDGHLWMPYNLNNFDNATSSSKEEEALRADLFHPENCDRILLKGVTFQNSPRFTVHPTMCTNIVIDGVTAKAPWNVQNADGIDLSNCKTALLVNCYVDCGDDGLCLKSGSGEQGVKAGPCKDILIQDCKVAHAHGGFVFGSDVAGGMENIVVRHCSFSNTDIGLRFKSAIGRGGLTKNIRIYDIVMTDIANEAIMFNCGYFDNRYSKATAEKTNSSTDKTSTHSTPSLQGEAGSVFYPDFNDIIIDKVVCRESKTAISAYGIEGLRCIHDIVIKNSSFFYRDKAMDVQDKNADIKMENVKLNTFTKQQASSLTEATSTLKKNTDSFLVLDKKLPIKTFRVDSNLHFDSKIAKALIRIKSKSNSNLYIDYYFDMNNSNKGGLIVNGHEVQNIGAALHDLYIYYNLSSYAPDLYIWGIQPDFPTDDFIFE